MIVVIFFSLIVWLFFIHCLRKMKTIGRRLMPIFAGDLTFMHLADGILTSNSLLWVERGQSYVHFPYCCTSSSHCLIWLSLTSKPVIFQSFTLVESPKVDTAGQKETRFLCCILYRLCIISTMSQKPKGKALQLGRGNSVLCVDSVNMTGGSYQRVVNDLVKGKCRY